MKRDIEILHHQTFEEIKQIDEAGNEFWYARALAKILDYAEFRNFLPVIEKARQSCINSGNNPLDHLVESNEMVLIGSAAQRSMKSYALSRYACYLIVQNADSAKPVVANGQTYFAIQTRRQELSDDKAFNNLREDEQRLFLRNELKEHNKQLVDAASNAGVKTNLDFAIFQNHGYKGLYGGLGAKEIQTRKGLRKTQKILDHMGSTELAANLFRATQAEEKLIRDKIHGKKEANQTHFEVGKIVRETIESLGGEMPENLPPSEDIQKLERKVKSGEKKLIKESALPKIKGGNDD
jgi:DNA-damage-inducible protein D